VTGDRAVRWATVAAVAAVAGVAAYVSYWHAVDVVTRHGERGIIGHLYPVAIDGIIVAASMVLLDAARNDEDAPALARWLLGAGIAVTLAANVTYGVAFGAAGALWAAWPAIAFVGCYELLMMLVRAAARRGQGALPALNVPRDNLDAAIVKMAATAWAGNPLSGRTLGKQFELSPKVAFKVRQAVLAEANGHAPPEAVAAQGESGMNGQAPEGGRS
jgi:Protein of unknown function (DUF2637)